MLGGGVFEALHLLQGDPQIDPRIQMIRVDRQGRAIAFAGFFELCLLAEGVPQLFMRERVIGLEFDRPSKAA